MFRIKESRLKRGARRGSALILTLVMTVALASLAISAIFLTSNASILSKYFESERGFRYAAEAALAQGKSRLNVDTALQHSMPDSGYTTLLSAATLTGADGQTVPGATVNLYMGRTGNFTGQYGNFASIVAEARDASGARYVRRLEMAEENFAKWIYWQNTTDPGCYAGGEAIVGPMWSNVDITACTGALAGARFTDEVNTAGNFVNQSSAIFTKQPPHTHVTPMALPTLAKLSNLPTYATTANYNFTSPGTGATSTASIRIEFVAIDLDADGLVNGIDEGFFRVWTGTAAGTRADYGSWTSGTSVAQNQCGAFLPYPDAANADTRFVPYSVRAHLTDMGFTYTTISGQLVSSATLQWFMARPLSRCYPAGDSHLAPLTDWNRPGSDTSFYPQFDATHPNSGRQQVYPTGYGSWSSWTARGGTIQPTLAATGRADAAYLYPLARATNPASKGVIYFTGTVAVSGVLRGRVTLYSGSNVTFIDDVTYATSPSQLPKLCADMLGVIAANNVSIADNSINSPQSPDGGGHYYFMSANHHFFLHGVVMALNTTFIPDNFTSTANGGQSGGLCNGYSVGSGCLYQTGGVIVQKASATFTGYGGSGYMENRTYDQCMAKQSPPYFPTTGRYFDNRYYEIDPVRFDVTDLFHRLTPAP